MVGTNLFRTLAMTVFLVASLTAWTQNTLKVIEITQQDFTKADPLRSTSLSILGIRLSQKEPEAQSIVRKAGLSWKKIALGANQDKPAAEILDANGQRLGIVLRLTGGEVDRIDLEQVVASRLVGNGPRLLSDDVIEPTSSTRLALLGHEDEYHHENSQFFVWREFKYFKEGIEIDGQS